MKRGAGGTFHLHISQRCDLGDVILTFSSIFKDCIKYFHKTFPRVMAVASRLEFSKYSFEGTVGETAELNSSV